MLDAGFLHAEDSDRHVSLAIGALSVLAGPMPDFDSLAAGLAERILSVPRFRQVLRTQPLDLGAPQWVDNPNVDISHHVRRAALPRPGDDAALFGWVAEVMERRLDRDRPLWECWIVDGLQHNRWAILIKDPPLHRRRDRGDTDARAAVRQRWRQYVRDPDPCRPRTNTKWPATAGTLVKSH